MLTCACSYDGGASTIYSYKLPMPPGDPTCVSYCGEGVNEQEYESEGRRMQERYGQAMGGDTATPYITSTRRTGDGGPPMTLEEELAEADAQRFLQTSARVQEEARRAIEERVEEQGLIDERVVRPAFPRCRVVVVWVPVPDRG